MEGRRFIWSHPEGQAKLNVNPVWMLLHTGAPPQGLLLRLLFLRGCSLQGLLLRGCSFSGSDPLQGLLLLGVASPKGSSSGCSSVGAAASQGPFFLRDCSPAGIAPWQGLLLHRV